MFLNREEGALVSSQDTESTEYFWGEILHSLLNLVLLKKKDFQVINQNIIKTSIENKICHHGLISFYKSKVFFQHQPDRKISLPGREPNFISVGRTEIKIINTKQKRLYIWTEKCAIFLSMEIFCV